MKEFGTIMRKHEFEKALERMEELAYKKALEYVENRLREKWFRSFSKKEWAEFKQELLKAKSG